MAKKKIFDLKEYVKSEMFPQPMEESIHDAERRYYTSSYFNKDVNKHILTAKRNSRTNTIFFRHFLSSKFKTCV